MATKMGWFDVPLGAETRQLVATADQAISWINTNFGKPLKYYNSAADMREIWKAMLTNGIVPEYRTSSTTNIVPETQLGSSFSVSVLTGLKIQINPGIGWIDGAYCIITEPVEITVAAGTITDITLKLDMSGEDVVFGLATKTRSTGTAQGSLIRTEGVYELGLHSIEVPPNTTALTSAMITDLRLDVSAGSDGKPCCGIVGSLLQPDITALVQRVLKSFQEVLDQATPPDGNLASGIFVTDSAGHFDEATVEGVLGELYDDIQQAKTDASTSYAAKSIVKTFALTVAGWTGDGPYTQAVTVAGVTADTNAVMDYTHGGTADAEKPLAKAWSCITKFEAGAGKVTATCLEKKPESNLTVRMMIIG